MPSKKKKYNARFPAGRIKKIMQTDEEVGKVAQAVPVIISRTLELFVESLLTKSMQITLARNAKTLTPSHMKQCILSESRFDFLKDLVKDIPDASVQEDNENNLLCEDSGSSASVVRRSISISSERRGNSRERREKEEKRVTETKVSRAAVSASTTQADTSTEQSTSTIRTPVIKYNPKGTQSEATKLNFSVDNLLGQKPITTDLRLTVPVPCSSTGTGSSSPSVSGGTALVHSAVTGTVPNHSTISAVTSNHSMSNIGGIIPMSPETSSSSNVISTSLISSGVIPTTAMTGRVSLAPTITVPPLAPLSQSYGSSSEALCIDEDYDN